MESVWYGMDDSLGLLGSSVRALGVNLMGNVVGREIESRSQTGAEDIVGDAPR